jgi:hypothetical protein
VITGCRELRHPQSRRRPALRPIPPGGVPLLTAEEAAELLGMSTAWLQDIEENLGLIKAMDTQVGPRYREDELLQLAAAAGPAIERAQWIRPGEAARRLGVTVPTLRKYAGEGWLHRDRWGMYNAIEIGALNRERGGRKFLRPPEPAGHGT